MATEDINKSKKAFVFLLQQHLAATMQDPAGEFLSEMVAGRFGMREAGTSVTVEPERTAPAAPQVSSPVVPAIAASPKPKRGKWSPEQLARARRTREANKARNG